MIYTTIPTILIIAALAWLNPLKYWNKDGKQSSGVILENFDQSIRPQDNFYEFVNGSWLKRTEIPGDKSDYSVFSILDDQARKQIKAIIDELDSSKELEASSEKQKIRDLYDSFMNQQTIESRRFLPISEELAKIDQLQSLDALAVYFAHALRMGIKVPFGIYASIDFKDSGHYAGFIGQSGLGLPDRDHYFQEGDRSEQIRNDYKHHLSHIFTLIGAKDPSESAKLVFDLEVDLAKEQLTRTEARQREKIYNPLSLDEIKALTPNFDWDGFFRTLELSQQKILVVNAPDYLKHLSSVIEKHNLDNWKTYLKWQLINRFAPYLHENISVAHFNFYGQKLRGTKSQEERWKRGVSLVNSILGDALGKEYVARHFKPEAKARMELMVANLQRAYEVSIRELPWMSKETKAKALAKLSKFQHKIGYPNKWKDITGLEIKPSDLVGNIIRASFFEHKEDLSKISKEVDREEWHLSPQTVNAYYHPTLNEIVFPAAILQAPFFSMEADDAVNYGGIGAVIGHEMGHGFDDQGAKFDGDGMMTNWWSDSDLREFKQRTKRLVDQFGAYEPLPGHFINGSFTLGENIGDLGGLTIALKAYQMSAADQQNKVFDGFTGIQRFFVGWAQIWPRNYRQEELINRLLTDPHSPSEYRVNGIVANLPEFYEAFQVKEVDRVYIAPDSRVKIW
ncbi:MAG: M13 family metallopeptidase [Oligoflexales bacterium]